MAEKVKNSAGGKGKSVLGKGVPFSFEVQSPVVGGMVSWNLERSSDVNTKNQLTTIGTVSLTADPLIGAEFIIDMLAAASRLHPIVFVLKTGLDIGLDILGGSMTLELKFYGKLNITIDALKFDTLSRKIGTGDTPLKIDGAMGVIVALSLKVEGTIKNPIYDVEIKFNADAYAHAYFGGTTKIQSDKQGVYADVTGKFSGLLLSAKIEMVIGGFKKKFELKGEPIFSSEDVPLGKYYLVGGK